MDKGNGEKQILRRALKGSREDFGKLYDLYFPRIYRYLYHRTFHRETAEDLTSRCFLKALDKLSGYSETRGSFSAWIYRIAANCLVDHFRREGRITTTSEIWEDYPSGEDFVPDAHNRICWEQLKPAVQALPPEKRELLFLRIWDGLSFREIAELTGKSEAACKMGFMRTLEQLRKTNIMALVLLIMIKDMV